jgi:hypothetical protein
MSAFDDFSTSVLNGAEGLARTLLKGKVKDARADAEAFIRKSASKLDKWTKQVASGELTQDEFASLVRSQRDLAELSALTQAGIGQVELGKFRDELTGLVLDKAIDILL